jgi:hypothetical protein
VLVWRDGLRPQWRSLDTDEAQTLSALQAQPSTVGHWLAAQGEGGLGTAVAWLQTWCADGLLQA